jgi:hypothetical protein
MTMGERSEGTVGWRLVLRVSEGEGGMEGTWSHCVCATRE